MAEAVQMRKAFKEEGIALGHNGPDLIKYIDDMVTKEEQKRSAAEEKRAAAELALEEKRAAERAREIAAEEAQRAHELALRAHDLNAAEAQRAHEIRLAEIAAGTPQGGPNMTPNSHTSTGSASSLRANTPSVWTDLFQPQAEDFSQYLRRFEDRMSFHNVPFEDYCQALTQTLRGPDYELYTKLPLPDQGSYHALRNALLKRYELHAANYAAKFRSATLLPGESYCDLAERLRDYLLKWIDLSETSHSFEGMIDLMLTEQLGTIMPRRVKVFLAEQGVEGLSPIISAADRYLAAHRDDTQLPRDRPNPTQPQRQTGNRYRGPPEYSTLGAPHFNSGPSAPRLPLGPQDTRVPRC